MTEESKRFSLRAVTVTALISFLVSGVGGALLQRYLSRALPLVTVTSAGFEGPADYVDVPDDLLTLSQDDAWGPNLAKYEKFGRLRNRESSAAELEASISKAIGLAEAWLKSSEVGADQVSLPELLRHPLVMDVTFGSSLHGNITRHELPDPPVTELSVFAPILRRSTRNGDPTISAGKQSIRFPTIGLTDSEMNTANMLAADSFSRGVRRNIVHYTKCFLDSERANLLIIKKLRERLRALILEQARPAVSITIHNAGNTPVAFRPYFGMAVLGNDAKAATDTYLMLPEQLQSRTTQDAAGSLASLLRDTDDDGESKDVRVDPYLALAGGLSYTTVPPGASTTLKLVATEKLGSKGPQYRTSYESGLLNIRILALTISRPGRLVRRLRIRFERQQTDRERPSAPSEVGNTSLRPLQAPSESLMSDDQALFSGRCIQPGLMKSSCLSGSGGQGPPSRPLRDNPVLGVSPEGDQSFRARPTIRIILIRNAADPNRLWYQPASALSGPYRSQQPRR